MNERGSRGMFRGSMLAILLLHNRNSYSTISYSTLALSTAL